MIEENPSDRSSMARYFPFISWGSSLNISTIRVDLLAGITNSIIVLPQGVAYAMIAGLPPEYGLYTAIIPAIIAALFGSSWHLISGPTAALSIVVYTTISPLATPGSQEFIALALTLTFMAGAFQIFLASIRLGSLVNFVSHSVVIGFTSGAAVVIASSQYANLLGLDRQSDGSFVNNLQKTIHGIGDINLHSLSVGIFTIISCVIIRTIKPRWPSMLLGLILACGLAFLLDPKQRYIEFLGAIPSGTPPLSMPDFSIGSLSALASGALAISMLGLVEATAIARSVATRSHQKLDGNQEFIGQGLSNVVGAFFSCYASSGSFTRTGVNYTSGARTPLSAVFAAISLFFILAIFSDITAYVPIPAMAGMLCLVSWHLIDLYKIRVVMRAGKSESIILISTFTSTLLLAMEFSIYAGVILSLVFYLKRTSRPRITTLTPFHDNEKSIFIKGSTNTTCPQLRIIRIEGSLFFGASSHIQQHLQGIKEPHLLIVGNGINFIDIVGAEMLAHEAIRRRDTRGGLYLSNLNDCVYSFLDRNNFIKEIGNNHIFYNKGNAILFIYRKLNSKTCETCTIRIFKECSCFSKNTTGDTYAIE